jgi:hypothetical protein
MNHISFVIGILGATVVCWIGSTAVAQTADETFQAAIRLKQAHVVRSYERCIATGKTDRECRAAIERLHPREIAALARFASLAGAIPDKEISASLASCYDPSHDYLQLIQCWEETASLLDARVKAETGEQAVPDPAYIEIGELERHLVDQLRCIKQPNPIFAFLALEQLGLINKSEKIGYDSISCFNINGGFEVEGLTFDSICGHSEDGLERQLFPDFLWRGPGTSPGQFISLGTQENVDVVAKWYQRTFLGAKRLNQAIRTKNTHFGDPTEVQCSDWMRN